jgi:hypothetical protein
MRSQPFSGQDRSDAGFGVGPVFSTPFNPIVRPRFQSETGVSELIAMMSIEVYVYILHSYICVLVNWRWVNGVVGCHTVTCGERSVGTLCCSKRGSGVVVL